MVKQDVAKVTKPNTDLMFDPANLTKETIKNYLCKEASDQELTLGLQIAKTCNLNPLKREIYFIKYGNNPMMTVTGYEVYLKRAEASGQYDGMELTCEGSVKDNNLKAKITVYRKDWKHPLIHEVKYSEYVQKKQDGTPNKFWAEKPETMTKKVAVSQGFRMAFPEQLQGLPYTADEAVDQEHIIDVKVETTVAQPPKTEPVKTEVVKPVADKPKDEPKPAPTTTVEAKPITKTVQGLIEEKKVKSFVNNGVAGNKYGCRIGENWYGTFNTKVYEFITEAEKNRILVDCKYLESTEIKEGKTLVYFNIIELKAVVAGGTENF
jgi:phage recombination protein Bet